MDAITIVGQVQFVMVMRASTALVEEDKTEWTWQDREHFTLGQQTLGVFTSRTVPAVAAVLLIFTKH